MASLSYFCFLTTELTKIEVWKLCKQERLEKIMDSYGGGIVHTPKGKEKMKFFRTCSTEYKVICVQEKVIIKQFYS